MSMEFWNPNLINTTTQITVYSNTASADNLYDRDPEAVYNSSGDNSDATTTTIRIEFSSAQNIDRIALQEINWRGFKCYYNSNTANVFTISGAATTTSTWSSNSETSLFLMFATTSVSIVTFQATTTMVANAEKEIGELWIGKKIMNFVTDPAANDYKIKLDRKEYAHIMSDGGTSTYIVNDNITVDIDRDYVDPTEWTSLRNMYQIYTPIIFVPEPTGTAWNSQIWEVNWIDDFGFYSYQHNYKGHGYKGTMKLRETPK